MQNGAGLTSTAVYSVVVNATTAGGTARHIILVQDDLPWQTTSLTDTLIANGFTLGSGANQYEVLASSSLASRALVPGNDFLIIVNDQTQTFYDNIASSVGQIERFAEAGGV